MEKKYYPAFIERRNGGNTGYFVKNINTDSVSFLSKTETELFIFLRGSKTLEEHLDSIKENERYNISDAEILKLLNKWIEKGFLRSEELLIEKNINIQNKTILISGCITYGRPKLLERWLLSKTESNEYKKLKPQIVICDDTEKGLLKKENDEIIKIFKKKYSGIISCIGWEEKKIFADLIKKTMQAIPKDIIDFTLNLTSNLPETAVKTGGNRNTLTLISAGTNLYSCDDDIEHCIFNKPSADNKLHFSPEINNHPDFYSSMEEITALVGIQSKEEILPLFTKYTGIDPRAGKENQNIISYQDISPEDSAIMEKNQLKIKIVTTGFYGGRWYKSPVLPILQLNDNQPDFFIDIDKYREIINKGLNIQKHDKYFLDRGDYFIGGNFCMDNTELPSLCFPLGRRQDLVFGAILKSCLEPGLKLNLPHIIFHNPAEKKQFYDIKNTDISLQIGDYSTRIINCLSQELINPPGEKRLKELGNRIQDFSTMNYSDFYDQLKLIQLSFITETMNKISYMLELYESKPVWLADDLKTYYELLKNEAISKNTVVPHEFRKIGDTNKAMNLFRNYLFKCGGVLIWWPEIWETARTINIEGRGFINLQIK